MIIRKSRYISLKVTTNLPRILTILDQEDPSQATDSLPPSVQREEADWLGVYRGIPYPPLKANAYKLEQVLVTHGSFY